MNHVSQNSREEIIEIHCKKAKAGGKPCSRRKRENTAPKERVKQLQGKRREEMQQESGNIEDNSCSATPAFENRMAKTKALRKTVGALPQTPTKKAELLQTISLSPGTRKILTEKGLMKTPKEMVETRSLQTLAADISEGMQKIKRSKS